MAFRKFVFAFCLAYAFVMCSCTEFREENTEYTYTFENASSFTIQVSLSEEYSSVKNSSYYNSSILSIYKGQKSEIYVKKKDVDFHWSTSNISDSSKVYCVVSGSKAAFKDR